MIIPCGMVCHAMGATMHGAWCPPPPYPLCQTVKSANRHSVNMTLGPMHPLAALTGQGGCGSWLLTVQRTLVVAAI